jgi:hypothetical protein
MNARREGIRRELNERRRATRKQLGLTVHCECPLCTYEQNLVFKVETLAPCILYGLNLNDDQEPNFIQEHLIKSLRNLKVPLLDDIANMIDPAGDSPWRLELKRRRTGKPKYSRSLAIFLWDLYDHRREELSEEKHPTPAKTALGEVAAEFSMPDSQLRSLIERAQGKRRRSKRAKG